MTCKGTCRRYKPKGISGSMCKYAEGRKWCQHCAEYVAWEGIRCPCCGYQLRSKPRYGKYRQKMILKRN